MKIDVEGAEGLVLKGMDFHKFRPWVLIIESTEPGSTKLSIEWESLVIENGYQHTLFDGLNRFYVAKEKAELLGNALSIPANVFDGYQRHVHLVLNDEIHALQKELSEAKCKAETLEVSDCRAEKYDFSELCNSWIDEFAFAVQGSRWLSVLPKASHHASEVGYCFLYLLYRLLDEQKPKDILEFNFGQATKMTAQYAFSHKANHTVLEHDRKRVEHFAGAWKIPWKNTAFAGSPLVNAAKDEIQGVLFRNYLDCTRGKKYDLVAVKCPFIDDLRIPMDLLQNFQSILRPDFAVLMDHIEDDCGNLVFQGLEDILMKSGVQFVKKRFVEPNREIGILASESWKYVKEF